MRRYFNILNLISFGYYNEKLETTFFYGDVEIDETVIFKEKKSKARHRPYKLGKVWIFGIRKRSCKDFIIIPVASRHQEVLHKVILKCFFA